MRAGLWWLAMAGGAAWAAAAEPIDSGECRAALRSLDAALAAAPAGTAAPALRAAQREAARACLGRGAASAPRAAAPPPQRVPRIGSGPAAPVMPSVPAPSPAAPRPAQPLTVTACDDQGCWTSDGARWQRVGTTTLSGPRGVCTQQGSILVCP